MAYQLKYRFRRVAIPVAALVALCSCGAGPSTTEVWTESVIGVWGGTIQATQGDGSVAYSRPDLRSGWEKMRDWMTVIPEAIAAVPDCPIVTGATCDATETQVLRLFNNNCFGKNMKTPLYRRHYVTWNFPAASNCNDAVANGFAGATITNLVGKTLTRGYGYSNAIHDPATTDTNNDNDQVNRSMASNNELNSIYTAFYSGWQENTRAGGIDVTFVDANTRKITIKGIHIEGDLSDGKYAGAGGFELADSSITEDHLWDHTVNTVKNGDPLFTNGPGMRASGSGVEWQGTDTTDGPTAPADADAIVVGYGNGATIKKGAAARVQHNHSNSIGVSIVEEDLVFGDSTCCWPTAGKVHTEFDRFYDGSGKMPWPYEDISFGPGCGDINYETSEGDTGVTKLHHCY